MNSSANVAARFRVPPLACALALEVGALTALAGALVGVQALDPLARPQALVLVDRSDSVPRDLADAAVAEVVASESARGVRTRTIAFAATPAPVSADLSGSPAPDAGATDIEAALSAALAAHAVERLAYAIVVSDGRENRGDATRALAAARDAGLPIRWRTVSRAAPETRIASVLAPRRASPGQRVAIDVELAGRVDVPRRVTVDARTAGGSRRAETASSDASGRATIELRAPEDGPVRLDVALDDADGTNRLDRVTDAAVVDVVPLAPVLYVRGSAGVLADSLRAGGWPLDVVAVGEAGRLADRLGGYRAIVLDDVAVADASPAFWQSVASAVRDRGTGLMVLGGERAFAAGGYRESTLEALLPVVAEPAALAEPLDVVFAVDKSGSMGEGVGVNRFQLAQRAVIETAQSLSDRDGLGVIVFDVAPRVLVPLDAASVAKPSLARDWPVTPQGGTRLAPAIDAAIDALERRPAARRMLAIVTDGFVDDEDALLRVRHRLRNAGIETIAIAIGRDADAAALERLVNDGIGTLLRVAEAAELPATLKSGIERRRARVARGRIAVHSAQPLPIRGAALGPLPDVDAYAVTRARPGARVAVRSATDEPLIAFGTAGQGRVVAVTCGFGAWTAGWLRWAEWPRLAAGLVGWAAGASPDVRGAVSAADEPRAVRVDVDLGSGLADDREAPTLTVTAPDLQMRSIVGEAVAPGLWRASMPEAGPGLYVVSAATSHGVARSVHLRADRPERESWGPDAAIERWKAAALIAPWTPDGPSPRSVGTDPQRPVDRSLIGLALALFLTGVVVDRRPWRRVQAGSMRRRASAWVARAVRWSAAASGRLRA